MGEVWKLFYVLFYIDRRGPETYLCDTLHQIMVEDQRAPEAVLRVILHSDLLSSTGGLYCQLDVW